jgi:hypothetical protein
MKEQHIEIYDVDSYTSLLDMKSSVENHIKRGWFIKTMYKPYSDYTVVVYEREVVDKSDENVS